MGKSRALAGWCVFAVIVLWTVQGLASAQVAVPDNATLIAAMPDEIESVYIKRFGPLTAENSVLKKDTFKTIDSLGQDRSEHRDELLNVVMRYVAMAGPILHAEGASDFTYITGEDGVGIGEGNYNGRSIWYVERSLEPLMTRLAERRDVTSEIRPTTLGTVTAYETEVTEFVSKGDGFESVEEGRFVAFPTDHCVVITEDREELACVIQALAPGVREFPARWKPLAADLDVDAPLLLLRYFSHDAKFDYYSPFNPMRPESQRADIEGFGLVMPSPQSLSFRFNCVTNDPQKAKAFFETTSIPTEIYKLQLQERSTGFLAEITGVDAQHSKAYVSLTLLILFGPNIFI